MIMNNTTVTTTEAKIREEAYCSICKACKGHYTKEHEDWVKIPDVKIIK